MLDEIFKFLLDYGYILLAVYCFSGGYLGIIAAAYLSTTGQFDITIVILISIISNFIGDNFYFFYFYFLKKYFKPAYNKIIRKYPRKMAYTKLIIKKKGNYGMFIQKYIKYVRILYPIILSTMNYDKKKFLILNFFASIFWALSIILPTYFFTPYIMKLFQ